jgi:putative DNA primase/helicase
LHNLPHDPAPNGSTQGLAVLEAALLLAASGIRVFPVYGVKTVVEPGLIRDDGSTDEPRNAFRCGCGWAACPNPAKHPVGRLVPHGHNDATTDLEQIKKWFEIPEVVLAGVVGPDGLPPDWAPYNLGVATGKGLVVLDADAKQLRTDLPNGVEVLDDWETWTRGTRLPEDPHVNRTGSGGLHLWLSVDPNLQIKSRNRVLPALDVKADGGYVLAPPSLHITGNRYKVVRENAWGSAALCSPELVSWLLTVKGGRYITRRAGQGALAEPDNYDFYRILGGDGCPSGHRDYFVNDLCFRLRKDGTSLEKAAEALRLEWLRMEQPPGDEFDWDTCLYKLRRVWEEVDPGDISEIPAWRPPSQAGSVNGTTPAGGTGVVRGGVAADGLPEHSSLEDPHVSTAGAAADSTSGRDGVESSRPVRSRDLRTAAELLARPDLTFKRSDTGNGERFAQRMREMVRYCVGEQRWYIWDGSRWIQDTLNQALHLTQEIIKDLYVEAASARPEDQERVANWAQKSESLGRREAMLRIAASRPGIAIEPNFLDADPWLLSVRNGTVDLRTGTLRESLPGDMNTRRAEVDFDQHAKCPLWEKHLEFVTRGDRLLSDWLRRAAGYTLTGLTGEHAVLFLWGTGANGKSTFLDVLGALLGSYAAAGDENLLTSTSAHPTQLADLRGARLIVCDETDREKKLAEQRIKMMTGKQIKARFMRQDFFTYTPRFKIWVSGNHKPEIRGGDDGIWRRLKLVPFTAKLTNDMKILDYEKVLIEELPGILNWALTGLRDWMQLGQLGEPEAVRKATVEYRSEEDAVGQWLAEMCEVDPANPQLVAKTGDLFTSWSWWAHQHGFEVGNSTRLGRELTARGIMPANEGKTIRIDGEVTRARVGILLRRGHV